MINQVDVAVVVDTTASMGSFIRQAQDQMADMIISLSSIRGLNLRGVLIDYRDHPPQDPDYPAKLQTGPEPVSVDDLHRAISNLTLGHGGDMAESVFDGVDLLSEIGWRPHSARVAFLVGDAPGHGYSRRGDFWPDGCPCGRTSESVSSNLEEHAITLYGVVLSPDNDTYACFDEVCGMTGGYVVTDDNSIGAIREMLEEEFGNLELDRRVLDTLDPYGWDIDGIARSIGSTPYEVGSSVRRLLRREFITSTV